MDNHTKYQKAITLNSLAGVGVVFTRTREPFRCIQALREYAFSNGLPFGVWNVRDGWRLSSIHKIDPSMDGITDPYKALKRILDLDNKGTNSWDRGIFVMHAVHHWLGKHPAITECLRHYVRDFSETQSLRLILVCPEGESLPVDLQHDIPVVDYDLPTKAELRKVYDFVLESSTPQNEEIPKMYSSKQVDMLLSSASGMTEMEAEMAFSKAIVENKPSKGDWYEIDFSDFNATILKAKTEIVKQSEVLELLTPVPLKEVGGLENYKEWIKTVAHCLSPEAIEAGVDKAKGAVVVGPPGCLSKNTQLSYLRGKRNSGRRISLLELYKKFNGITTRTRKWDLSKPTKLQSFDMETGKVVYNEIEKVIDSGIKLVVTLRTQSGKTLDLTANHPILTANRGYVECSKLERGEEIIVVGSMLPSKHPVRYGRKPRVVIEGLKYYSSGWEKTVIQGDKSYKYRRQHRARLVVEARMNSMDYDAYIIALKNNPESVHMKTIPNEFIVHHIDENPMNDDISNLCVMLKKEHDSGHNDESKFNVEYTVLDKVDRVISTGKTVKTFDIQMKAPLNNFAVANGLITHNTGKTLLGKTTSTVLSRPLVRVDISKCFAGIVGQSEAKARSAIKQLEAMSPVVALIDEVDKALGGAHKGSGDAGVSQRVLGIFLTAMQESKADIFWILTANRVNNLPSEMLRKGRTDEVFAVLPPNRTEREAVFRIHLKKRKVDPDSVEGLDVAIEFSRGYVPAEIEAAVKEAKKVSFSEGRELTGEDLYTQIKMMKPISEAFPTDFEEMEHWARNNARNASISDEEQGSKCNAVKSRKRSIN